MTPNLQIVDEYDSDRVIQRLQDYLEISGKTTVEVPQRTFLVIMNAVFNLNSMPQNPLPPKYEAGHVTGYVNGLVGGNIYGKQYQYDFDDPNFRKAQQEYPGKLQRWYDDQVDAIQKGELKLNMLMPHGQQEVIIKKVNSE